MIEFTRQTLGQICDMGGGEIKTGPFGSQLHQSDYTVEGIPVVMPKNIILGSISLDEIARIGDHDADRLKRHKLGQGDIVYGRRGDIGRHALISATEAGWLCGTGCLRITVGHGPVGPLFLHYYLEQEHVIQWIHNHAIGATMPNLNTSILRSVPIDYPPTRVQRKIATILSAYDDLIENNLRRIKILEEMAQNLYREWFVKFRFPGHENVRFTDSDLGRIPEGWEGLFPDFVDFKEGPGLRKWQYRSAGLPFLNIRTLVDNDIDLSKVQYLDPKEVEAKYQHFLLEEYDHVVSSSGTLGRIVTIRKQHLPLMLNTSIIRMRPSTKRVGRWQLMHFLQSDYFQHQILSFAIGAAQPNFGPTHLQQMRIVGPSDEIGILYEETVEPLEELIGSLVLKNATLRRTRDLLVPKLISGEVDVSELDIQMSEGVVNQAQPLSTLSPRVPSEANKHESLSIAPANSKTSETAPSRKVQTPLSEDAETDGDRRPPIDETDRSEVLQTIRQVFSDGEPRDRETAIREIARALGYRRAGNRIQDIIHTDLLTASRRGILENSGGQLSLFARSLDGYERDFLKQQFLAAIGRTWIDREEAIREFCRWMGFARTGQLIEDSARSLINGLLREDRIESDNKNFIRRI